MDLRPAFIAGVAETPLGEVWDHSELSMAAVAAHEALAEAGMTFADVDALFTNYMGEEGTVQLGEYLGVMPHYADSTDLGGAAFEAFVHHAVGRHPRGPVRGRADRVRVPAAHPAQPADDPRVGHRQPRRAV